MVARKLTHALHAARTQAAPQEEKLQQAFRTEIIRFGRAAARRYAELAGITAAADWHPPSVADVLALSVRNSRIMSAQRQMLQAVGGVVGGIEGVDFTLTHPITQRILDTLGRRVAGTITGAAREPVAHAISTAFAEGATVPETAAAIRAAVSGVAGWQSVMLARTDLIGMSNGAGQWAVSQLNDASAQAGEPTPVETKTWLSSQDERVRDTHAEADGQTVPVDDVFLVGEATLQYPGDPDGPDDEVINCFPAETLVEMPSLRAAMRRWYEGDMVTIRLATGDVLAATPNHPVLTDDGFWTAIGDLVPGRHVVSARSLGSTTGAPDPDRQPLAISEVYRLANVGRDAERVALAPPDLHGDNPAGEVEVVAVDGSLLGDGDAPSEQEIAEFGFSLTALARIRYCGGDVAPVVNARARHLRDLAAGLVSGSRERSSLPIAQPAHAEPVRVGAPAYGETQFPEASDDRAAARAYRFGDGKDGFPGVVTLTEVIEVNREPFQGYVYNLDTGLGWYTAASVACRNCRCVLLYNEDSGGSGAPPDQAASDAEAVAAGGFLTVEMGVTRRLNLAAASATLRAAVPFKNPAEEERMTTIEAELAVADGTTTRQRWGGDIAFEGVSTGDGRYMVDGSLSWREPPLTLMAQVQTPDFGGHAGAEVAGRMDTFAKNQADMAGKKLPAGVTAIYSEGVFDTGEHGQDIERLVGDETLRGVSVDLSIEEWGFRDAETGEMFVPDEMTPEEWDRAFMGELEFAVIQGTIMATTVCPTPAFADARITLLASAVLRPNVWRAGDEFAAAHGIERGTLMTTLTASLQPVGDDSLVAAGGPRGIAPLAPPVEWFTRQEPGEPTPLTITDAGEIFGHIALWNTCHTGYINGEWSQCVRPPRSQTGYARFHVGEIVTAEGEHLPIGKLTIGTGHAPMTASPKGVRDHYDNTGHVGAFVRATDGQHGVFVSGATRSDMTGEQLRDLRANPPSGDWRAVDHNLELHAALAVPVPGFPVQRSQIALAASGAGGELEVVALILTASIEPDEQQDTTVTVGAEVLAALIDGGTEGLDALIQG